VGSRPPRRMLGRCFTRSSLLIHMITFDALAVVLELYNTRQLSIAFSNAMLLLYSPMS
jgi:hypothetical protein